MGNGVELATAYIGLSVSGSNIAPQVRRQFSRVSGEADRAGRDAGKRFGSGLTAQVGKVVAGAFAVREVARFAGAFARVGNEYTSELAKIEALTTAQQRAQVGGIEGVGKTLEANAGLYAKYGSTVGDAAAGVTELVKAGQSLPNSLREINATMVLAKAGEMSVADASGVVATALTNFGLKANRAGDVANYLANAANISTADVSDLAEALKFVAPVAAQSGISVQHVASYLAELSNAGINGTLAGTGLRKVLQSLQAPAGIGGKAIKDLGVQVYNAEGKARPFQAVMEDLGTALDNVSEQKRKQALRQIFGLTGVTAATVLLKNGTKGLNDYTKGVERAGAAQKLAAANSKGLVGTLKGLGSLLVSDAQAIYRKYSPIVDDALQPIASWFEDNQGTIGDKAKEIADDVASWGKAAKDAAEPFGDVLIPALEHGVDILGKAEDVIGDLPSPLKQFAVTAGIAALAWNKLVGPTSARVGAWASTATASLGKVRGELSLMSADRSWQQSLNRLSAAGIISTTNLNTTSRAAANLRAGLTKLQPAAQAAAGVGGIMLLMDSTQRTNKSMGQLERAAGLAAVGFAVGGPLGLAVGATGGLFLSAWQNIKKADGALTVSQRIAKDAAGGWDTLTDSLNKNTGAFTKNSAAAAGADLSKDASGKKLIDFARDYGISQQVIGRALIGNQPALAKVNNLMAMLGSQSATAKAQNEKLSASIANGGSAYRDWLNYIGSGGTQSWSQYEGSIKDTIRANQGLIDKNDALRQTWTDQARGVGQSQNELRKHIAQLKAYKLEAKGIPKKVATNFEALSGPASQRIKDLIRAYHLTPKEVRTLAKVDGSDVSKKQLAGLIDLAKDLDRQNPTVRVTANTADATTRISNIFHQLDQLNGKTATTYVHSVHTGGPYQANARGSLNNPGGWSWIGEEGPELMYVPKGADIYSNQRSRQMIANNAGGTGAPIPGGASIDLSGMTFEATITNWDEGTIRMEAIADDRVDAHELMVSQTRRARGGGF